MSWRQRWQAPVLVLVVLLIGWWAAAEYSRLSSPTAEVYRVVVLSDIHLPVRPEVKDTERQQKIIAAKNKVRADVNSWDDVWRVAVIGDLVAGFGTDKEREYAAGYFSQYRKPLAIVLGNHDYIYEDSLSRFGTRVRGDAALRAEKIRKFRDAFHLPKVYYSQKAGQYLLIFLSVDSLDSGQLTQMSEEQLNWLRQELAANTGRPTIIFFHAPLKGTLTNYRESINTPDFVAQPDKALAPILRQHPQVFLWVSGHTHTAATQNDFAAPVNAWEGRIMNIHNADMDRETIWTNSLYLYPDKVVIRTFDHAQDRWLDGLERTIALPALPKRFWPWQR